LIDLELLADTTTLNIILCESLKARPPVVLFYSIICFKFPRVSSCLVVMEAFDNVLS